MLCYLYLRASTKEQDATRAEETLRKFAADNGLTVAGYEVENESGATLKRPALFKILDSAPAGAAILVEQVDRLTRLDDDDWLSLRSAIESKKLKVIALDLPTSHQLAKDTGEPKTEAERFTARMLDAINSMLMDMLAAVARKDYTDRRRRQAEGIAAAKAAGHYQRGGRQKETKKREKVIEYYLKGGYTPSEIARLAGLGLTNTRATIKEYKASQAAQDAQ